MEKLSIGQKLWWVPHQRKWQQPKEVTVLKVGRKWAQLDNNERIDLETFIADAGQYSSPGRCYLSQEEYEAKVTIGSAWSNLKRSIDYKSPPDGVTVEDIEAARQLLRLPSN